MTEAILALTACTELALAACWVRCWIADGRAMVLSFADAMAGQRGVEL